MKIWLLIFVLSSFIGALFGKLSLSQSEQIVELSSSYGDLSDPTVYPCPSEQEYKSYLKQIKFEGDDPLDCKNPKTSKLGRALKFLAAAKVALPARWKGANDALEDPLGYLIKNSRSVKLDSTEPSTIAKNKNRGEILLGGRFLVNDTLDSVLTLLHESRHSNQLDPGHFTCRWGDIAGNKNGCDQTFSNDELAGAYAYQVLIGVAWAKYLPNLNEAQREFLLSTALYRLATRFNVVPNTMAAPVEQIFVLDESGAIYPVSPLTGKLLGKLESPDTFSRLSFYSGTNGFLAFTKNSASYLYRPSGRLAGGFFKLKNLNPIPLRDVASLVHKSENESLSFQYILTAENELKYFDTDSKTGDLILKDSPYQPKQFGLNLYRLANARRMRYALTVDHKVFYLDDDVTKIAQSSFVDPSGFNQIDGGLFYANLVGVTGTGEVKTWNDDKKQLESTTFSGPVLKLQQSVSFTAALLDANKIELQFWDGSKKIFAIDHPLKIKDLVITRGYQLNRTSFGTTILQPQLTEAVETCDIVKAYPGIWSSELVGINRSKQLVTYNLKTKSCGKVDLSNFDIQNENVQSIELTASDYGENSQALSFPLVTVRKTDGSAINFKPYKFK